MLYVFIVSSGDMVKFDMNLAVKKVIELKVEIEKLLQIPVDDQVLLCSGGEELKSENIVGNYFGAGTDTNPIFLFSKYTNEIELRHKIATSSLDSSIEDDVSNCSNMAPSSNTAAVRVTLAQRFADIAVSARRSCDELVHSQHLQQQGWAAVVANLDDAKEAIVKRIHHFEELYEKYLANRSLFEETIRTFPADVELLSQVPLLPKLMVGRGSTDADAEHTLLSWFCSEPLPVLQSLTEKYHRSLEELDQHTLADLNEKISAVLKKTDNPDIKEVKGIAERLSSLNKQIEEAKKIEKEQRDLAAWFSSTQTRISRDPAVLPDLCGTFQDQLVLMLGNHKCLRDILDRCTRAKNELSENINYRIKYICCVESEMYDLQVRMVFLEKHVLSVMKQYDNFKQVHLAPQRYFQLLAECCRRKTFSSNFMKWSTELSSQAFKLYEKEVSIRKCIMEDKSRNMVDNLFPGLDDMPPPFATECPEPFDQKLPNIEREDLDVLKIRFPDFRHLCEVPAPEVMPQVPEAKPDSVFSSHVLPSQTVGDSADVEPNISPGNEAFSPCKLSAPSGDCISLPSEYASLPNEAFSLASSPFEDPLLPNCELELAFKRSRALSSEMPIHRVYSPVHESDAEEFETLDRFVPPVDVKSGVLVRKNVLTFQSASEANKFSKTHSEGDAVSPVTERLKRAESGDFQAAEYYIDDSMPSSYTESSATSPLLQGNRMVKSHHLVVSELQKQIEEKASDCDRAQSLVEKVSSSRLKWHAQMYALQKLVQELRSNLLGEVTGLQGDLSNLRDQVKDEFRGQMAEVTKTADAISQAMLIMQKLVNADKEKLEKEKHNNQLLEKNYLRQLEIETQKLNDAEAQICNYEEYIYQLTRNLEDIQQENKQLMSDVDSKKELIKSMMLEHELELDSMRNEMKQNVQSREDKICELTQNFSQIEQKVQGLEQLKLKLEEELLLQRQDKESAAIIFEQKEAEFAKRLKDLKQLQDEIRRLQDGKSDELQNLKAELAKVKGEMAGMKKLMEEEKTQELAELEEKLKSLHKNEMDSLRSRFKLTTSVSPLHLMTSTSEKAPFPSAESADFESLENPLRWIEEKRKEWEEEKEETIQRVLKEQQNILEQAVADAVNQESVKRDAELANLIQEHEDSIEKIKSRQMAEVQVSFNEAINSVTKEKEFTIESLRSRVSSLESNLLSIKLFIDKYAATDLTTEPVFSQSDSGATSSSTVSENKLLHKLKSQIEPYLQILYQGQSSSLDEKELLKRVKTITKHKYSSCSECTFKISILSCDAKDLILLCYEEKYENFVVFHFGPYVHFLHADSLQPLGLKIPAGPSERWALGVVISKEFCVARKPSNRYKINLGAKFYRVKVMPWDKEKSIRDYQLHKSRQPTPKSPDGATSKSMSTSSV